MTLAVAAALAAGAPGAAGARVDVGALPLVNYSTDEGAGLGVNGALFFRAPEVKPYRYALSLNLAIWVGSEMEEFMIRIGRTLPRYQGNDSWMLPIPATFVVGRDGRIVARFVDPDYRKRMAIDELIAALK